MEGPLLVIDPKMLRKVEHCGDAPFNFISTDLLGHLTGPIGLPPEFISRMCPLLAGLDSPKSEICCHDHPIQPSLVYQRQELCHLLHPIGARSLQPPGVANGDLIHIACHIRLHLWHVGPSLRPVLHNCVQRGGDVLTHHPVLKLQVHAAYDPRSRSPRAFKQKKWRKRSKCGRMPR